jgi:hypothetical protein
MANTIRDNERKACDAVARSLEDLLKAKRSNAYSPEDDKVDKSVEYVFDLSAIKYAMEHTIVEAFDGQIRTDVDFDCFVSPITNALDYNLPGPSSYHLCFAIDPGRGLKNRLTEVQARIIEWVKESAIELYAECLERASRRQRPRDHRVVRKATVQGVKLELSCEVGSWLPGAAEGRLFPVRFAPDNYEALRHARLQKAMSKKLPKLQRWKEMGARTVLILEDRDIALSNHIVILEAAENALRTRSDRPDELWLVDTTIPERWTVWCLIRDGVSFPDEDAVNRYRQYNPRDLVEV